MSVIPAHFKLDAAPAAAPDAVVVSSGARFTVLTDRLIRLEYHPDGLFEDRPSLTFWHRNQPVLRFEARNNDSGVEIETEYLHLRYSGGAFTPDTLSITLKSNGLVWHPGMNDAENLRGTTRTLDFANGYEPLQPGLM